LSAFSKIIYFLSKLNFGELLATKPAWLSGTARNGSPRGVKTISPFLSKFFDAQALWPCGIIYFLSKLNFALYLATKLLAEWSCQKPAKQKKYLECLW
jgi:hypothetical protein